MKSTRVIEFPALEGYPADYLVARLGGRRGLIVRNWEATLMAEKPLLPARYAEQGGGRPEEAVRKALKSEIRWVARQMDGGLREIFRRVFVYFELGTLFSCIRYRARSDSGKEVQDALESSLLSRALREALVEAASQAEAMRAAEEAFSSAFGIHGKNAEGGEIIEAEQRLTDAFLSDSAARARHPVIRGFFRTVVDMRNMVSVYKRLRWGIEAAPPVIEGGSTRRSRFRGISTEPALLSAIRRFTGLETDRPSEVENLFLKRLLAYSKEAARNSGAVGSVLDYMLRCHVEARNLGLIFAGGDLDREILRAEIVP